MPQLVKAVDAEMRGKKIWLEESGYEGRGKNNFDLSCIKWYNRFSNLKNRRSVFLSTLAASKNISKVDFLHFLFPPFSFLLSV